MGEIGGIFRRLRTFLSSLFPPNRRRIRTLGDQTSGIMLSRNLRQTTWGRALSCCKINLRCCTRETGTGRKTSIPVLYCCYIASYHNQRILRHRQYLLSHNRTAPKSIPLDNASVVEAFPTTSENATSTFWARKSETEFVSKKDQSPLSTYQSGPPYGRRARKSALRNRFRTVPE